MPVETPVRTFPMPRDRSRPFDPPAELQALQQKGELVRVRIWDGSEPWLITRYAESRLALRDDRFSADPLRPGYPEKSAAYAATLANDVNMRTLDNPEHDVHKRMVISDFTVAAVQVLRPQVQAIVDGLITEMLNGPAPADIFDAIAAPIPTMVICDLMGVPYEDREFFTSKTRSVVSQEASTEEAAQAGEELNDFLADLIDKRHLDPQDDMISRAVHEQMNEGTLEREHLISLLRLILIAGHESTKGQIAMGVLCVLQHPEVQRELTTTQDRPLITNAVEELMRYTGVLHFGRRRVANQDVVLAGKTIGAGEGIIVVNSVADRDELVFPDAATLDIRRTNARSHIGFGYGLHACLGQMLARMEMQEVHAALWRRVPTLQLAVPFEKIEFDEDATVYSIRALPVRW